MKKELGFGRCGLACALCDQNVNCTGCDSGSCPGSSWCENRRCSMKKGIKGCYECDEVCEKGLLGKIKPHTFSAFIKKYGVEKLLACLEENEKKGVVYHREGITGDYDDFDNEEALMKFILGENK